MLSLFKSFSNNFMLFVQDKKSTKKASAFSDEYKAIAEKLDNVGSAEEGFERVKKVIFCHSRLSYFASDFHSCLFLTWGNGRHNHIMYTFGRLKIC